METLKIKTLTGNEREINLPSYWSNIDRTSVFMVYSAEHCISVENYTLGISIDRCHAELPFSVCFDVHEISRDEFMAVYVVVTERLNKIIGL